MSQDNNIFEKQQKIVMKATVCNLLQIIFVIKLNKLRMNKILSYNKLKNKILKPNLKIKRKFCNYLNMNQNRKKLNKLLA